MCDVSGRRNPRLAYRHRQILNTLRSNGPLTASQVFGLSNHIPRGTIHTTLQRLEHYGLVRSMRLNRPLPGPPRRLYSITESGKTSLI